MSVDVKKGFYVTNYQMNPTCTQAFITIQDKSYSDPRHPFEKSKWKCKVKSMVLYVRYLKFIMRVRNLILVPN